MADTPHLDALLAELLGLDEVDLQLPVPVLVNMHRSQLRAPLRGLKRYSRELNVKKGWGLRELQQRLTADYGLDPHVLELDRAVLDAYSQVSDEVAWALGGSVAPLTKGERRLLVQLEDNWVSYDPLVWLFYLTCREVPQHFIPELIEAELVAQPASHRMILDMAVLGAKSRRHEKTS
jgi:hypothetical protein